MKSKKVILKEADFAGFKVLLDGISVYQFPTIKLALENAKSLDPDSNEFELHFKNGDIEVKK